MYYREKLNHDRTPLYNEYSNSVEVSLVLNDYAYYKTNGRIVSDRVEEISEDEFNEVFYTDFNQSKKSEAYQPTNAEVAQMISDLQADLIIAGVI